MQEKLSRREPFNFGSSQDAKRIVFPLLRTCHGIFHPPSKRPELPSDAKEKSTPPAAQCLLGGCGDGGRADWGQSATYRGTEPHRSRRGCAEPGISLLQNHGQNSPWLWWILFQALRTASAPSHWASASRWDDSTSLAVQECVARDLVVPNAQSWCWRRLKCTS